MPKKAPAFQLPATGGNKVKLADLKGKRVVLFFYPKDATPGCTQEGQDFRDLYPKFKRRNTEIFGISRDSIASHEKFKEKQGFPFELLSDADEVACRAYDVIHEKNMYGKKVMGIVRSTFLIDEDGKLVNEWRKVKVDGHAEEVLAAVAAL
jgi:thioredoxin-dependent peroxiredoxin